jgi:site-specific DNA-methyltransferase (adenine-specific)
MVDEHRPRQRYGQALWRAHSARSCGARQASIFKCGSWRRSGAQPYKGGKKGMDRRIDGYLHFRDADRKPQFGL